VIGKPVWVVQAVKNWKVILAALVGLAVAIVVIASVSTALLHKAGTRTTPDLEHREDEEPKSDGSKGVSSGPNIVGIVLGSVGALLFICAVVGVPLFLHHKEIITIPSCAGQHLIDETVTRTFDTNKKVELWVYRQEDKKLKQFDQIVMTSTPDAPTQYSATFKRDPRLDTLYRILVGNDFVLPSESEEFWDGYRNKCFKIPKVDAAV
jgi:hypothetical protein